MPYDGPISVRLGTESNGISDPFAAVIRTANPRWWLHALLLAVTILTTSVMGAAFHDSFQRGEPVDLIDALNNYAQLFTHPELLLAGLPFSATLLSILLTHELGHYLTCLHYRVAATPPFFIPFPAPIGTFGAFIRIKGPIYSRRILFDIAAGGPLAGFAVLLPMLAIGMSWSKVIPGIAEQGEMVFGVPLVVRLMEQLFFPGVAAADIYLHPVARAAWVGVLATALNLLPIGQLDGGHILYSFFGERTRLISRILVVLLVPLGIFYSISWLFWAAFLFFFGLKHPMIYDPKPIGAQRIAAGVVTLLLLILCFTVEPVRR